MSGKHRPLQVADSPDPDEGPACILPPLAMSRRRADLREVLATAVAVAESEQGFVIRFPATDEAARAVCDAVLTERACCARFRYVITLSPGDAAISLRIDARENDVGALKSFYAPLLAEAGRHG